MLMKKAAMRSKLGLKNMTPLTEELKRKSFNKESLRLAEKAGVKEARLLEHERPGSKTARALNAFLGAGKEAEGAFMKFDKGLGVKGMARKKKDKKQKLFADLDVGTSAPKGLKAPKEDFDFFGLGGSDTSFDLGTNGSFDFFGEPKKRKRR